VDCRHPHCDPATTNKTAALIIVACGTPSCARSIDSLILFISKATTMTTTMPSLLLIIMGLTAVLCSTWLVIQSTASDRLLDAALASPQQHRRLQTNNNNCPRDSVYYCNDPSQIAAYDDDTVQCDPDTCRWVLSALDASAKPKICNGITLDPDTTDTISGESTV
jgi:hypothetical protein